VNEENQSPRWLTSASAGAALTVLAGLLFLSAPLGRKLAELSFDLPFRWRPHQPTESVVVIYMDEPSAKGVSENWGEAIWNREQHARLVTRLQECRAKAVVFDILFDQTRTNDHVLVAALEAARRATLPVILGAKIDVSTVGGSSPMTNLVAPIAELEKVAVWGVAEYAPQRRHFPGAEGVPSLALRAAELTLPQPRRSRAGDRWINFYGPPGFIRHVSFAQALDPQLTPAETFAGKVCFVGALNSTPLAGGVRVDESRTPYSRWGAGQTSGVELTATVYLNLAREDWLTRAPVWGELCIVLVAGVLFGFGLASMRPILATVAGFATALLIAALASWWMWDQHIWFSWLTISVVQIPVAVGWCGLAYTRRLHTEKAQLQTALAKQIVPNTSAAIGLAGTGSALLPAETPRTHTGDLVPPIPDHALLRAVGRGSYGEVWLARNAIGSYHAVKIVRREAFDRVEPFEREFRGLQKFMPISRSHPGLVQILHVGRREKEGFIYYVMEAADDETTGAQINPDTYCPKNLAREIRRRGHLPAAECLQLGVELSAALEFLHLQRLIHRDIKPANIIFVRSAPKFADIGLVTEITNTGPVTYVGTKGYIAPEGPGTAAADVYSLGKVLYEASMGLGCELFPELPDSLVQRPDHADLVELNRVLLKACRQDRLQRYQSAAELGEALLGLKTRLRAPA